MPSPLAVEENFQQLVEYLRGAESFRQKISWIREFLALLDGEFRKYESYIIQLIPYWPVWSGPITYTGIPPDSFINDLELLREIRNQCGDVEEIDRFSEIALRTREVAIVSFCFAGDPVRALYLISKWTGSKLTSEHRSDLESDSERDGKFCGEIFKKLRNHISEIKMRVDSGKAGRKPEIDLSRLMRDLDYILKERKENCLLVPVTEQFETADGEPIVSGRIRCLTVQVNRETDDASDIIEQRFRMIGAEEYATHGNEKLAKAARLTLKEIGSPSIKKMYRGEIYYEFNRAVHIGNSSGAAIAALWACTLQKHAGLRERFELNRSAAITGDVDEAGNILTVAEQGIRAKAVATFFSWSSLLVVPLSQQKLFREEIEKLEEKYSGKKVTLFAFSNIHELFYDRRVSRHINPSKLIHAGKQIWNKKFETAGLVTIMLLTITIILLAYGPLDKNPALYEFSGEMLKIKNQSGAVIEQIPVGVSVVNYMRNEGAFKLVELADINGDGTNEIILGETDPQRSLNSTGILSLKEVGKKSKIWEKELHYDFNFPNKPFIIESKYRPIKIIAGDFNGDGEENLLVNISHVPYFPGVLSLRDAKTGEEVSHFVNPGRIIDFAVADLTGDGQMEVVIGGVNNAYNQAFVAILDINHLDGIAPTTEEYRLNNYKTPEILSYTIIPKTIVSEEIAQHRSYNQARRVQILTESNTIQVQILDFSQYRGVENVLPATQASLLFYFNNDLSVRGIGTSDGYDLTANYLFENGIIDRLPDHQYFDEYKQELLYWNGKGFVGR